jgi:hypothetical protein
MQPAAGLEKRKPNGKKSWPTAPTTPPPAQAWKNSIAAPNASRFDARELEFFHERGGGLLAYDYCKNQSFWTLPAHLALKFKPSHRQVLGALVQPADEAQITAQHINQAIHGLEMARLRC